jgi:hypothetical protein
MHKFLRILVWALPLWLGYQLFYQGTVLYGLQNTYNNGEIVSATVQDFRIKQIAAQTNGYIILDFMPSDGQHVHQKLSLPVQLAAPLMSLPVVDVRFLRSSPQPIVMTPVYRFHRNMVIVNMAVLLLSVMATTLVAIWATRWLTRKIASPDEPLFERIDTQSASQASSLSGASSHITTENS